MSISCIIIDDEPLARKGIMEYIEEVPFLQLTGSFENPLKAAAIIDAANMPLLFLDIQMPKITGIDFFKSLPAAPPVIFTTAYPQYALDGFNLNALDYLVKPISFERFYQAALKAKEYYDLRKQNAVDEKISAPDYFFIKTDGRLQKIFFNELIFIEALQNYVNIYTTTGKYITYLTFKSVEEYLPAELFLKTHKSYIVSLAKINSIDHNEVKAGIHSIPISRNLKDEVMKRVLSNRFLKR